MTKRKKATPPMITANIVACIKAIRLVGDGKKQEAWDLMKNCTPRDVYEATDILDEIGKRHHAKRQETMRDILTRAAAAGDEEARALIACGLLEQKVG
jgi:hypothetical protein